ncbi:ABC transporter permease [Anaerocolumna xylanovorans]|uniref:ABC-type transport system, involved in lipoprotein release, permease component n=1 Tax=Anaerocolumna xylanovorans DSM 12503 TaxID=1121345 RepID=A0A1M7Y5F5_9FIRM|nr:FtsX-like permease family protein [Anaerocolumna xylanovorans]SHO47748.1 ABC-type transport system, involved in lipoprotein release, permease component [Anaerocolumna xylanovorans DSM 12503]
MKKILQCFWKDKKANRGSLAVLMITVILSTTAVFGVINALPLLKMAIGNDMKNASYGRSDFVVNGLEYELFSLGNIKTEAKVTGILNWYGILKDGGEKKCEIAAADYSVLPEVFDIRMADGEYLESDTKGAVITKWLADKLALKQGDVLKISINDKQYSFTVSGIALNRGLFADSTYLILLPKNKLDTILGVGTDDVNIAYIYDCDAKTASSDIGVPDNLHLKKVVDEDIINSEISLYALLLVFILIFVFLIAFYIIYNVYNIFVVERAGYIGTLRSCGATRKYIRKVFITANIIISAISGMIGTLLGGTVICLFAWKVMSVNYLKEEAGYMLVSFAVTMFFAIVLAMVSISIPLNHVLKYSERALLNNEIEKNKTRISAVPVVAFAITLFLWGLTSIWNTGNLLTECIIFMLFIVTSIIGIRFFVYFMDRIVGKRIGKGPLLIAAKNVIHNIYVQKNITLIAVLSILLILVGSLSYSVLKGLTSFYNNYKCNAYFETYTYFDKDDLQKIKQIEGLDRSYPCISKRMMIQKKESVSCFIEDSPEKFSDEFLEFNIRWKDFSQDEFAKGRYCILSDVLSKRYNLSAGDYVEISRENIEEKYQIAAICYTTIEKGNFIFLSTYDIPFENCTNPNLILADCDNVPDFFEGLEAAFADRTLFMTTVEDKIKEDEESSKSLIAMFMAFSLFVVLIGVQGIYNNFKLSYINRKKEFAVMISNGYRMQKLFQIIFIETILCSLAGGIIALIYIQFYRNAIVDIMFLMDLALPLINKAWIIVTPVLLCIAASLVSILVSCRQISGIKKNMINILKI